MRPSLPGLAASALAAVLAGGASAGAADVVDPGASAMTSGAALERQGRWPDALAHYQAAITARERALGPDHPLVAEALVAYATLHRRDGDGEGLRVRPILVRAYGICPECVTGEADVVRRMWGIAPDAGILHPSAEERARELLRAAVARHGERSVEAARAATLLVEVLLREGRVFPFPAIPASVLRDVRAEYWSNLRLAGEPVLRRPEEGIDRCFGWGAPAPNVAADDFSVRWSGWIVAPASGAYRIGVCSDGGYRLRVGGRSLVEDWTSDPPEARTAEVHLEAGEPMPFEVEYFEGHGSGCIRLGWTHGPGIEPEPPGRGGIEEERDPAELLRFAIDTLESLVGPGHTEVGWSLHLLASVRRTAGELVAARTDHERAMSIFERSLGPDHGRVAMTLRDLAMLPDTPPADRERILMRSVEKLSRSPLRDQPNTLVALRALERAAEDGSLIFDRLDRPHVRESLLRRADQAGVDEPELASELAIELGDGQRALAILERAYGPDDLRIARLIHRYGWIDLLLGDVAGFEKLQRRALAILEAKLEPDDAAIAATLGDLSGVLRTRSPVESLLMIERSTAIWERKRGPESPEVGVSLISLAEAEWRVGRLEDAGAHFERALAIERKSTRNVQTEFEATAAAAYATFLLRTGGDLLLARTLLEEAIGRMPDRFPSGAVPASVLSMLAEVEARLGNDERAGEWALRAVGDAGRVASIFARLLGERRTLAAIESNFYEDLRWPPPSVAVLLTLAARGVGPRNAGAVAWDALARSRALLLDEAGRRNRSNAAAGDPEARLRREELGAASSALAGLLVRGDTEGEAFAAATARHEAAESALMRLFPLEAKGRAETRAGLGDVRRAMPAGAALVALVRADAIPLGRSESSPARGPARTVYVAFVLPPGAVEPTTLPLGDADAIDLLVANWRLETLRRDAGGYRVAGTALRRKIWDPIARRVGDATRVLVVPDGALHLVNLAALPVQGGSYLVETGPTIHYLSAERDVVAPADRSAGSRTLLAVGGADYEAASPFAALRPDGDLPKQARETVLAAALRPFRGERSACGNFKAQRFPPLPATAKESGAVAALWRAEQHGGEARALLLTGAAAAEAAVKAEAPGARVLHLATHGFFLGGACAETDRGARGIGTLTAREASPSPPGETLRLSGLALAGANHRESAGPEEEDGVLTAEEIAALDLSNVEWAVLSACDTGVGDIRTGEGVFGLRRAFQVAGAGTLIASLWPVDDESTREWMTALYEGRLKERLDTAEAVRRASLKVLERRRAAKQSTHPFHWAAFVASGDWR